jgi:hypothetical protein
LRDRVPAAFVESEGAARTSAGTRRARARIASTALLGLGGAKTCFCLLIGPLELAQTCRTRVPRSVGLRFVQPVALPRVSSLGAQIV